MKNSNFQKFLFLLFPVLLLSQLGAISLSSIEKNIEEDNTHYFVSSISNLPILQMDPAMVEEVIQGVADLKQGLGFSTTSVLVPLNNTVVTIADGTGGSIFPNGKYSPNPSEKYDRESTGHQSSSSCVHSSESHLPSSISHLLSPTAAAVSTAYSLQPTASIRPVGRIVTPNVLRLRGGGQKSSNTTGVLRSTRESEEEELNNIAQSYRVEAINMENLVDIAEAQAKEINCNDQGAFEEVWNYAKKCAEDARLAWTQVVNIYQDFRGTIPENGRGAWVTLFNDAKYKKAKFTVAPYWFEVYKMAEIATAAQAEQINFDSQDGIRWNHAKKSVQDVELALDKLVQMYQDFRETIPESEREAWDMDLHDAQYKKAWFALEPYLLEVRRIKKIIDDNEDQAEVISYHNTDAFEVVWDQVKQNAHNAALAWDQVIQISQNFRNTLHESKRKAWDIDVNKFQYNKALYTVGPYSLEAKKIARIAEAAKAQAEEIGCDDRTAFEMAWNKAQKSFQNTALAWDQVIQRYQNLRGTLPESEREAWDVCLNEAQYNKAFYTVESYLLEAKKITKIIAASEAQAKQISVDDTDAFEIAWSIAKKYIKDAELTWNQIVQMYQNFQETLPESRREAWDISFHIAQYNKAIYTVEFHALEAKKMEKIAKVASVQAEEMSFNDRETFEAGWNKARKSAQDTVLAWNKVVQMYQNLRETLPENQRETWDVYLDMAQYSTTWYTVRPHILDAKKIEEIADIAENKAKEISYENKETFEIAWNQAKKRAEETALAWDEVVQMYQNFRESLPENKKKDWDMAFEAKIARKAQYIIQPLWLEAERSAKITSAARKKAEEANPEDTESFEELWSSSISAVWNTKLAWDQVVEKYEEFSGTIPESQKAAWDTLLNEACYLQIYYTARSYWMEALKSGKIALIARDKALLMSWDNRIAFETAWNSASQKAEFVVSAWNNALQKCTELQESVPEKERANWDAYFTTLQIQREYWNSQRDSLQIERENKQQQLQQQPQQKRQKRSHGALSC